MKHAIVSIKASPGRVETKSACGLVTKHVGSLPKASHEQDSTPIDCPTCAGAYAKRPKVGGR